MFVQESRCVELRQKLQQAKQCVTSYTSAIENMKVQRDMTLSDIDRFQCRLDVCSALCLCSVVSNNLQICPGSLK